MINWLKALGVLMFLLGAHALISEPSLQPKPMLASTTEGQIEHLIIGANLKSTDIRAFEKELEVGNRKTVDSLFSQFESILKALAPATLNVEVLVDDDTVGNSGKSYPNEIEAFSALENSFNHLFDGYGNKWDSLATQIDICFISSCNFPRDRYVAYLNPNGSTVHKLCYNSSKDPRIQSCGMSTFSEDVEIVGIEAGNYHVMSDYAFVGYNVLQDGYSIHHYTKGSKEIVTEIADRLALIGEDTSSTELEIRTALERHWNKNLIWVGNPRHQYSGDKIEEYNAEGLTRDSWVPFYHLDLYFQPLGFENRDKNRVFKYAIVDPSGKWQNPEYYNCNYMNGEYKDQIDLLVSALTNTEEFVNLQLQGQGIQTQVSRVPMYIWHEPDHHRPILSGLYSPLNGLLTNSGKTFLIPHFTNLYSDPCYISTQEAAVEALESAGIEVSEVKSGLYSTTGALHCMTYETHRELK